jgi:hypothetical protein
MITKAKAMLEEKNWFLTHEQKKGKGVVQRKKMVHDKKMRWRWCSQRWKSYSKIKVEFLMGVNKTLLQNVNTIH